MKRFRAGDLAVTVNSRLPLVNDGHVVMIRAVVGPAPALKLAFVYEIERLDGQNFAVVKKHPEGYPGAGGRRALADQHQLRPLAGREDAARAGRQPTFVCAGKRP